ncbi:3092_t:CDS:1, partial [Paraglomus occultum]
MIRDGLGILISLSLREGRHSGALSGCMGKAFQPKTQGMDASTCQESGSCFEVRERENASSGIGEVKTMNLEDDLVGS